VCDALATKRVRALPGSVAARVGTNPAENLASEASGHRALVRWRSRQNSALDLLDHREDSAVFPGHVRPSGIGRNRHKPAESYNTQRRRRAQKPCKTDEKIGSASGRQK